MAWWATGKVSEDEIRDRVWPSNEMRSRSIAWGNVTVRFIDWSFEHGDALRRIRGPGSEPQTPGGVALDERVSVMLTWAQNKVSDDATAMVVWAETEGRKIAIGRGKAVVQFLCWVRDHADAVHRISEIRPTRGRRADVRTFVRELSGGEAGERDKQDKSLLQLLVPSHIKIKKARNSGKTKARLAG